MKCEDLFIEEITGNLMEIMERRDFSAKQEQK